MKRNETKKIPKKIPAELFYYRLAGRLIENNNKSEIAKELNISRVTLWRTLKSPKFQSFYEEYCNEIYQNLKNKYIGLVKNVIDNIEKYLNDKDISIQEKIKICISVLRACNIEIKF